MYDEAVDALKKKMVELADSYKLIRTEKVAVMQATSAAPVKQISASVGKGGVNKKEDVTLVQQLLNKKGASPALVEDGDCGNKTITAIVAFQKASFPDWPAKDHDGLISVGKNTWKKLSESGSVTPPTDNNTTNPTNNNNTTTPPQDNGSYSYYSHANWEKSKYTLSTGRTAKPLNATADRLLRSILAGAGISAAKVTSTWRNFADQAYCILTQVSEAEALKWYSYVRNNKEVFYKYKKMLGTANAETVYKEYGAWLEKNVGMGASNHLSGIAIDISGCDLAAFNKFGSTLVGKSGTGVKKVFPESGRTHIEFDFQVCNMGSVSTGGTGDVNNTTPNNNTTNPPANTNPTDGNVGESGKEVYLDQRDNPVLGDSTCNVTTLAMQLSSIAGGDVSRVQYMAYTILKEKGMNMSASTALEELLRQLCIKVGGGEQVKLGDSYYNAWTVAWVLDGVSELFKELVSKTETVYPELTQAGYNAQIVPAMQQGAEIMVSNKLTSSGHIAFLLAVRSDGIIINDPYGMMAQDKKYIRNGDPVSSHAAKYKDYATTIATRLKYNPELKKELDTLFASNTGTLPRKLGAKNFYTWAEVATYSIGKWANITRKK